MMWRNIMKKKKVVAVAVAAVMTASAVGVLAGCGKGKADYNIRVLLLANDTEGEFYAKYFDDLEKEFAAEGLSVDIKYNGYEKGDYYTMLDTEVGKGAIPDIFYLRPNEILQYRDQIANLQSFADTQDYVDLNTIYDSALNMYRFNPSTKELGNPNDDLYAFPKDLSTQQLGYNKTLLSQAEIELHAKGYTLPYEAGYENNMWTWEDYKDVCTIVKAKLGNGKYASEAPSLEILAKSFSGNTDANVSPLIDMTNGRENATIGSFDEGSAIYKAIQYQADMISCGAASTVEGYSSFTGGKMCFYGLVGSWEVADYNTYLGEGNWGVMPWPTVNKSDTWQGVIMSAGYVVSKNCVDAKTTDADGKEVPSKKGDIAKRIAISFMSSKTQDKLMKQQISLPLVKANRAFYVDPSNDDQYAPASRGVFMDVISGEHGFFPAEYSTYNTDWLSYLTRKDGEHDTIMKAGTQAATKFAAQDWTNVRKTMQERYDDVKNN